MTECDCLLCQKRRMYNFPVTVRLEDGSHPVPQTDRAWALDGPPLSDSWNTLAIDLPPERICSDIALAPAQAPALTLHKELRQELDEEAWWGMLQARYRDRLEELNELRQQWELALEENRRRQDDLTSGRAFGIEPVTCDECARTFLSPEEHMAHECKP